MVRVYIGLDDVMANFKMAAMGVGAFLVFLYAQNYLDAPASPSNYVEVTPEMRGDVLILTGNCRAVNMTVSEHQAISIVSGTEKKFYVRPMTHDIMKDMLDYYGIRLASARIDSFSDGIYNARIVLSADGKTLDMDARPTDAVGMAVRLGVPVLFNEELLDANGELI